MSKIKCLELTSFICHFQRNFSLQSQNHKTHLAEVGFIAHVVVQVTVFHRNSVSQKCLDGTFILSISWA